LVAVKVKRLLAIGLTVPFSVASALVIGMATPFAVRLAVYSQFPLNRGHIVVEG